MNTPLTRSRSDKVISGVCGGLARTFGINAGIVRVAVALLAVFTGVGWVAYLAAWALLPLEQGGPTGIDEAMKVLTQSFVKSARDSRNAIYNGDNLR